MKAVVIGAGFSGFTAAYFLTKSGYKVTVLEEKDGPGGLIHTIKTPWGLCETAANGILNSHEFEVMAAEIGLPLVPASKASRHRFIWRSSAKRWPLTFLETLRFVLKLIFVWPKKPRPQETIRQWGHRNLGFAATEFLFAPALQGIYAGDAERMSATLIVGRLFASKRAYERPKVHGLIAPAEGMGQFFVKMESYLKSHGVEIRYGQPSDLPKKNSDSVTVIATSATRCGQLLASVAPGLSAALASVEMLSVAKVTVFFSKSFVKGFGILFPRNGGVRSLGVLFNNDIFDRREKWSSESYILGGATDPAILKLSDAQLAGAVAADRAAITKESLSSEGHHIQRWERALPHYTTQWETQLRAVEQERIGLEKDGIFLIGNYWGGIGLSQLFESSRLLPQKIQSYKVNP